jgi:hypothetical protein
MKHALLAIFLFIASLPVEASSCDMHGSQDVPHSQHGGMMDHGQMEMDCCEQDSADSSCDCDPLMHCGASFSGAVTIDNSAVSIAYVSAHGELNGHSARTLSRYGSPPFRPPIV